MSTQPSKPRDARSLARLDQRYLWHPFTQMRDWLKEEPLVLVRGRGAWLEDAKGRRYLDANASIWTNLHGHAHPRINAALRCQLSKLSHCSALGFANEPASLLGERLVRLGNPETVAGRGAKGPRLEKVFYSDDGSTALEVALKLAYEFARRAKGVKHPRFLAVRGAYHGDTVGAVSLGHIDLFHRAYSGLLFRTDAVMAPYCYRCPFNKAEPQRADARSHRKCGWECVDSIEQAFARRSKRLRGGSSYEAFVVEPVMQGAAGMIAQPSGWLGRAIEIVRGRGAQWIADEVMSGFGRLNGGVSSETGVSPSSRGSGLLFASHREGLQPDHLAVAKGLTGGYLPMAATLVTQPVFDAFLGEYEEFKTFFHGHSFTANPLGAAAALASLELLQAPDAAEQRRDLASEMRRGLETLWELEHVGDIRQEGLVAGIELVRDWRTRAPFDLREQAGIRVCKALARRGVLTRPIGSVIALMPPYCVSSAEMRRIIAALRDAIAETLPGLPPG